jgi:hypothetical protein
LIDPVVRFLRRHSLFSRTEEDHMFWKPISLS